MNTQNKPSTRIVVVNDKFKGSLTASQAAEAIKKGILRTNPDAQVLLRPLADGGEGSMDVMERVLLSSGRHVEKVAVDTVGPLGDRVRAHFLLYDSASEGAGGTSASGGKSKREVFIEMAGASGLQLIPEKERDILRSTTYGFGEVIRFAVQECGVEKVLLAIGGSATNDGGFGMLTALGYRYKNTSVFKNRNVPCFLSTVEELLNTSVKDTCPELDKVTFEVACDVRNPLLGPNGATMVYGPQKGASIENLEELEGAMKNWAEVVQKWYVSHHPGTSVVCSEVPGAGAAGGVGFALYSVLGARLVPGWRLFSQMAGLENEIAAADLVITGEGRFDSQSLSGKLPGGMAELCREYGKPLWVVCGSDLTSASQKKEAGVERVFSLQEVEPDLKRSMDNAGELIINNWK